MAHFAKVKISTNAVTEVIVAEQEFINSLPIESNFKWIQTSYNTFGGIHYTDGVASSDQSQALRKNFAGIGFQYDESRDAFIPQKIYTSWVLNETSCLWEAPVAYPTDGKDYQWNEEDYQSDNTTGWEEVEGS